MVEAKYIALNEGVVDEETLELQMKKLLHELDLVHENFMLHYDNQSAIYLIKHLTFHSRSKHIDVRYQWIQDAIEMKSFVVEKIYTETMYQI